MSSRSIFPSVPTIAETAAIGYSSGFPFGLSLFFVAHGVAAAFPGWRVISTVEFWSPGSVFEG